MKESFWFYIIVVIGLFVIVVSMLVQDLTTTSEADYYLVKEVMEAAMVDAVDYGTYRTTGKIKIIEEKFVENFLRRFSESVKGAKTYNIDFYDIYESPPKASVKVTTKTGNYTINMDSANFDIVTLLSGVLETKY